MADPRNNTQIRCNNIRLLLEAVIRSGPVSKRELQVLTGLSWGAVSILTGELCERGYVVPSGKQSTNVGRKPSELDINRNDNYIIGIDLNMQGLCGVVTDLRGTIICERLRFFVKKDYDSILDAVFSMLDEFFGKYAGLNIIGTGVALQGVVNADDGVSVHIPGAVGWSNVPLRSILTKRYGRPVVLMHDPDCLMVAERAFGESFMRISGNAVLIRLDESIGLSVMRDGKLRLGENGRAGEFGHVPVSLEGPVCVCGNRGCLEEYSSGGGIVRRFNERAAAGERTLADKENIEKLGYKAIAAAARQGDSLSRELFSDAGRYLGLALSGLVNVLVPDLVVIYGDLTGCRELIDAPFRKCFGEHVYSDTSVKIVYSSLGRNAAARGAALAVSEHEVESLVLGG